MFKIIVMFVYWKTSKSRQGLVKKTDLRSDEGDELSAESDSTEDLDTPASNEDLKESRSKHIENKSGEVSG